jgi:hypothetical protein
MSGRDTERGLRRTEVLVVTTVALLLAALGWRQSAEFSVHMAFDSVALAPGEALFSRFYLAGGMDTESFRPLAVLAVRALSWLGGPLDPWLGLLEALVLVPAALAVLWWARLRGLGRLALPVTLLFVACPPALFNTWHLSEFDLVGAGLLLGIDAALLRGRRRREPQRGAALALLLAGTLAVALLKDSLAVLCLVVLLLAWLAERRELGRIDGPAGLIGAVTSVALFAWLLARPPELLGVGAGSPGLLPGLWRSYVVVASQLVALVGLPGVVAVLLGAFGRRLPTGLVLAAVLLHVAVPEPFRASFFGCYVFEHPAWPALLGGALLVGCGRLASSSTPDDPRAASARLVLVACTVFVLLPSVIRMRADVSARVLLPVVPALFALVLASTVEVSRYRGRSGRWAALLLAGAVAWVALAAGVEFGGRMLLEDRVELEVKRALAEQLDRPATVLPRNRIRETTPQELRSLRGEALPAVRFVRVTWPAAMVGVDPLREQAGWSVAELTAAGRLVLTTGLDVFVVGQRPPPARFGLVAERDERGPWPFPPGWVDQARRRRWSEPRGADSWFGGEVRVIPLVESRQSFLSPPLSPSDLFWRLVDGRGAVDRVEVRGELARLEAL